MTDDRVRYAKNGETRIAYRICGDEGPTVVLTLGWVDRSLDDFSDPTSA